MPYRRLAVALIAVIALPFAATASAKPPAGPKLTVPKADLAAAFHCPRPVENATNDADHARHGDRRDAASRRT